MTHNVAAAFINAQTALMLIEKEIMAAENLEREKQGLAHANGPKQWQELFDTYQHVIGYNACYDLFQNANNHETTI